ncbi:MAG: N-formylglutamate amidohydrolase [Fibrobacter sp.]|nr:N-formylglutamate amidohydrolase [Fibrobacter sp.]
MFNDFKLLLSCEHAHNAVPAFARNLNIPCEILESHRGYDYGVYDIYKRLVKQEKPDFYCAGKYSRLFIDLNRSLWNHSVFSEFWDSIKDNQGDAKYFALRKRAFAYYLGYRNAVEEYVSTTAATTPVLHLAIHSFTPVLNGKERDADIGILFDPSRPQENMIANVIISEIHSRAPELKVRKNFPYQGKTDGLCTTLRKLTPHYAGFEIEFNQKLFG